MPTFPTCRRLLPAPQLLDATHSESATRFVKEREEGDEGRRKKGK